jgi:hypothetical protein
MDSTKLASLQQAVSSSKDLIHQFAQGDQSVRSNLLAKLNAANSLGLSAVEIQEICSDPEPLMNGLELSDEDLAAISGGKGDSSISVGGNVDNSNVHSGGGGTTVSPNTSANVSK